MVCGRALGFVCGIDTLLVYLSSENTDYIHTLYILVLGYVQDTSSEKCRVVLEGLSGMQMPLLNNLEQNTYLECRCCRCM